MILLVVVSHSLIGYVVYDVHRGLRAVTDIIRNRDDLGDGSIQVGFSGFSLRPAIVYAFTIKRNGVREYEAWYNPYNRRVEVGRVIVAPTPSASPAR
jgi:hypothetical protein